MRDEVGLVELERKQTYSRHILELKLTGFTDLGYAGQRQGKSKNGLNSWVDGSALY